MISVLMSNVLHAITRGQQRTLSSGCQPMLLADASTKRVRRFPMTATHLSVLRLMELKQRCTCNTPENGLKLLPMTKLYSSIIIIECTSLHSKN